MLNLIIIPALNPNEKLIELINGLIENEINNILVIDDGSNSKKIFDKIEKKKIKVIHHEINKGKGAAIKTALSEYHKYFKNIDGFITADADGQHSIEDIVKINNKLNNNIIFGVRNFKGKDVPFRSKFGNKFSSLFLYFSTGMQLNDTQTGLRGFPIRYKDLLLNIDGDRFEYEMNVLMELSKRKEKIIQIPIKTIYENKNKGSNFKALKDSYRIFRKFIKYSIVSFLSALIDIILFTMLLKNNNVIVISTIISRLISGTFNFVCNKLFSFESHGNSLKELSGYIILFLFNMLLSGVTVDLLSFIPVNTIIIKIIVDLLIFIMNYYIQKITIFGDDKNKK